MVVAVLLLETQSSGRGAVLLVEGCPAIRNILIASCWGSRRPEGLAVSSDYLIFKAKGLSFLAKLHVWNFGLQCFRIWKFPDSTELYSENLVCLVLSTHLFAFFCFKFHSTIACVNFDFNFGLKNTVFFNFCLILMGKFGCFIIIIIIIIIIISYAFRKRNKDMPNERLGATKYSGF